MHSPEELAREIKEKVQERYELYRKMLLEAEREALQTGEKEKVKRLQRIVDFLERAKEKMH